MTPKVIGFVRQRVANMRQRRAQGASFSSWVLSGVGRYATSYAKRLETRERVGEPEDVRQALTAKKFLNFGCGYDHRDGFLNVDGDPACKPDVLVDFAGKTVFPSDFYEVIVAKDVLEHIPRLMSLRTLLQFNDWLLDGGRLELQTSSILGVADLLRSRDDFDFHFGMTTCLFGTQAHPGDFHYTGFTERTLKVLLLASNFDLQPPIELVDGWMFRLAATRASSWYAWADESLSDHDFMGSVFNNALGRPPQPHEVTVFLDLLSRGTRRAAALEIFSSPERLLKVARERGQ